MWIGFSRCWSKYVHYSLLRGEFSYSRERMLSVDAKAKFPSHSWTEIWRQGSEEQMWSITAGLRYFGKDLCIPIIPVVAIGLMNNWGCPQWNTCTVKTHCLIIEVVTGPLNISVPPLNTQDSYGDEYQVCTSRVLQASKVPTSATEHCSWEGTGIWNCILQYMILFDYSIFGNTTLIITN